MKHNKLSNIEFLKSALTEENPFISTLEVIEWLSERNKLIKVNVYKIRFDQMKNWKFDQKLGLLGHISGKFFTIEGIKVNTNWGKVPEWEQPIINQPEIGYLGIITKEFNGILYFLLQAKIEPGNVNNVQLSPTLQATKSNYTQVHKGKKPLYLEYFQHAKREQILLDQLQSEQGSRFLRKRNRNIIIKVKGQIKNHDDFIWLTLGQIKKLIVHDNLINMDTRTVISGISFRDNRMNLEIPTVLRGLLFNRDYNTGLLLSTLDKSSSLYTFDEIINWITSLKAKYELEIIRKSIFELKDWEITSNEIHHKEHKYFKVIAANVEIDNREVQSWTQPLVEPLQEGLIAFLIKKINGVYHFLIQAKVESGNFDIVEMAPTVQCLTGSYKGSTDLPFLDNVLNADEKNIHFDSLQSEEGGRFFREQNRNMIIEMYDSFPIEVPENYMWLTLSQMNSFIKFNNYLNIQSRSLIAALSFI